MDFQPCLAKAVALAAEVDCLISLAQTARDFRYCRPILTQDNVLHIKQGTRICVTPATWDCFSAPCLSKQGKPPERLQQRPPALRLHTDMQAG